jgi:sugar lactone lactonase YvrE
MKSNNKKGMPDGFRKDKDGNVYVAHDTSFDRNNRKKRKRQKLKVKSLTPNIS